MMKLVDDKDRPVAILDVRVREDADTKIVEVLDEYDRVLGQLPAVEVVYKVLPHGRGILSIDLNVKNALIEVR